MAKVNKNRNRGSSKLVLGMVDNEADGQGWGLMDLGYDANSIMTVESN